MVAVDGHVHFHDGFDLERFLESAAANFERAGRELGAEGSTPGVLMLAECRGVHRFDEWRSRTRLGPWSSLPLPEGISLRLEREDGALIIVVAGRQLVTSERLEVLALGVREDLEEGRELGATLDDVRQAGGLPVLPWGVGKWIGERGSLVARALDETPASMLFAGDNGGRWRALPRPALLDRAERAGLSVLPGSDPLPLGGEERRVGAFGFVLEGVLDAREPARAIRRALLAKSAIRPYGRGAGLGRFLSAQLAMQLKRRRPPTAR